MIASSNTVDLPNKTSWDYGIPRSSDGNSCNGSALNLSERGKIAIAQPELIQQYLYPIPRNLTHKIILARDTVTSLIHSPQSSLLVITGPSYIKCPIQAKACANWLNLTSVENTVTNSKSLQSIRMKKLPKQVESLYVSERKVNRNNLLVTMRANLTTPNIDYDKADEIDSHRSSKLVIENFEIQRGIPMCRSILCDLAEKVPLAGQLSDTLTPQYLADLFCLSLVSSTLVESQLHRELVSGSSFPVGFQTRDGDVDAVNSDYKFKVQAARDSVLAAKNPHHFLSITKQGQVSIIGTTGNDDTFIVLQLQDIMSTNDLEEVSSMIMESSDRVVVDLGLVSNKNISFKRKILKHLLVEEPYVSVRILGVMLNSGDQYISETFHKTEANGSFNYQQDLSFDELRKQLSSEDLQTNTLEDDLKKGIEEEDKGELKLSFKSVFQKVGDISRQVIQTTKKLGNEKRKEPQNFENLICANDMLHYLDELASQRKLILPSSY